MIFTSLLGQVIASACWLSPLEGHFGGHQQTPTSLDACLAAPLAGCAPVERVPQLPPSAAALRPVAPGMPQVLEQRADVLGLWRRAALGRCARRPGKTCRRRPATAAQAAVEAGADRAGAVGPPL